jgi:NAD(P)-dependent dehydrogenase (short-subunit alcohol dehydrogenase family)
MTSVEGKVVLITGGTSGIGRAAAAAFARAGARIVLAGRRSELGEQVAQELRHEGADVRFHQADVSLAADGDRLLSSTVEAYGRLDAAFNNAATAAKAGVLALTKSAAQEYATQGIRINALVAGAFRTPMLEHVFEVAGNGTPEGPASVEAQYTGLIPMRRIGRPEEAAEVAVWLCSDSASYVTGHSMIVDGGMTAATR